MELHQLKVFAETARLESMTLAAKKLFIAQSAVSQTVTRLETELGVKLFIRKGRGIILSDTGKIFYNDIKEILTKIDNSVAAIKESAEIPSGTLRLLVSSASALLPDLLSKYLEIYPDVRFKLTQDNTSVDYDVCISYIPEDEIPDNSIFLLSEEIKLAVPLSHSLSEKNSINLAETKYEDYILLKEGSPMRTLSNKILDRVNITPKISFESDNPSTLRELISLGIGISFVPELTWKASSFKNIKLLHITNPICTRSLYMYYPYDNHVSPALKTFLVFAESYFRSIKTKNIENEVL